MKILDRTFDTPEENLSCDEALLDRCEEKNSGEVLRFWEPRVYFVVLGFSNAWKEEVRMSGASPFFPVFRRASGGGSVLQGPGCLNYSLILKINRPGAHGRAPLQGILSANRFIMERHRAAFERLLGRPVRVQGATDLTLDGLKFSGNSQRRKKKYLLFHGTVLLDLDLSRVEKSLKFPPKQPAYRRNRPHRAFVTNLHLPAKSVKTALSLVWDAKEKAEVPEGAVARLAREKYADPAWTMRY